MTVPDNHVLSGASVFLVADVEKSAAYYRDALGFHYDRFWGDPPSFCMAWRDQQCVMLSQAEAPQLVRPISTVAPAVWDAYFWVPDADSFFAEFRDRGARIKYAPVVKPYGVKEFVVFDPDNHQLAFGEELATSP